MAPEAGYAAAQIQSLAGTAVLIVTTAYGLFRAMRKSLRDEIDARVHPPLQRVTDELSSHMADEMVERKQITKALKKTHRQTAEVRRALDERTDILNDHMAHDEETLKFAADALAAGQKVLLGQLDAQHAESVQLHRELTETVTQHVADDKEAFARVEEKLENP